MDDAQFAAYQNYLRALAEHFLIGDWQITLERGRSNDDARAEVSLNRDKQEACIWLNRDFLAYPPEQQRRSITHELLHVQTARMCRAMSQLADQHPDNAAVLYANTRLNEEEEIMIDRLARAIAPLMPLPPDGTEDVT